MPVLRKENILNTKKIISPKSKNFAQFFCMKNGCRNASLTVEAALVVPVFFFLFFLLWQCFLLLMFQIKVCEQVAETAMVGSPLGYIGQESKEEKSMSVWYEPLFWSSVPENKRVRNVMVSCEENKDRAIQVRVTYEFVCEAVFFAKIRLPVEQNFYFYPYRGEGADKNEKESGTDVVYVTEHGTVYHESKACVYLKVTLYAIGRAQIADQRNVDGEKYTECVRCREMTETELVYVSRGGNRYHRSLSCPAVKRNVKELSREEIGTMPACHKCKTKEETE